MVEWDRQPVYSRIICEMNVYESLIHISHFEFFQVNKDFFFGSCSNLNFLDGSNIKCHDDRLPGIHASISDVCFKII